MLCEFCKSYSKKQINGKSFKISWFCNCALNYTFWVEIISAGWCKVLRLQQHHHTKKLKPWRSNPTVEDNEYYILRHWSLRPTMTKSTIYCSNKEECETNAPCPDWLGQETEKLSCFSLIEFAAIFKTKILKTSIPPPNCLEGDVLESTFVVVSTSCWDILASVNSLCVHKKR